MKTPRTLLCLAVLALPGLAGRAGAEPAPKAPPALAGDAARPAAAHWIRCELYFGIGPMDDPDIRLREIRWQAFLDREVTPRFPDGLTVIDGYGQWRRRGAVQPTGLYSRILVVLCEDSPANRTALDAIRSAYKAQTRSQSVLLVVQPADVSF
jgi:hypothetical protein